jgi:hypothetical protein
MVKITEGDGPTHPAAATIDREPRAHAQAAHRQLTGHTRTRPRYGGPSPTHTGTLIDESGGPRRALPGDRAASDQRQASRFLFPRKFSHRKATLRAPAA